MQGVPDPGSAAAAIEFRAVTKRYPGREAPAVRELSLSVPAGEICVLIGPSGSGKTTAMKMVNRLIDITEGDITIGGQSVRSLDLTELRRGIGYVFQQIGLFPHMSVEDNIGTVPRLLGWDKQRIRDRVGELLELVGLEQSDAKRYPGQFSGGQRQRIGVARAMAADQPIMLMDEPFGAVDPIARDRLQNDFLRLHAEVRKTVIFVTHDIDEAIKMGHRVAILRDGELVQYGTPDEILASPANEFIADFVGADRGLKRLLLRKLAEIELTPATNGEADDLPTIDEDTCLRDALSMMVTQRVSALTVLGTAGERRGTVSMESLAHFADLDRADAGGRGLGRCSPQLALPIAQGGGPVIPTFQRGSDCVRENRQFCWDWFSSHWSSTFQPRLIEHIELTAIAVGIGFVIAFVAALVAYRWDWAVNPATAVFAFVYTIPSLAFFQLMVPFTGLTRLSAEIALVSYTLLILFRNILTGLREVPPDALEAAQAMGLTRRQTLWRVELPLAMPAIMAGIRIATVTIISLATVAAFIGVGGLGQPIFNAIQTGFKTQFIAAGVLAVALALVTDAILVVLQRALTPWARAQVG